jgi:guanosine-3',5'-bis(diphosphate) 3'-pyrophosphohydrolase
MTEVALLLQAVSFAAYKHRDQRRKDKEASPYINHPIEVAKVLATMGGVTDLSTLVAAVLHDTVEDTNTTFSELEKNFGKDVGLLVEEMTDDKGLPKDERKRLQVMHARRLSERAKQIKIGDKICNILDITNSPPTNWPLERKEEYLEWAEKVAEGCRGSNANLERYFDEVLIKVRLKLESSGNSMLDSVWEGDIL